MHLSKQIQNSETSIGKRCVLMELTVFIQFRDSITTYFAIVIKYLPLHDIHSSDVLTMLGGGCFTDGHVPQTALYRRAKFAGCL